MDDEARERRQRDQRYQQRWPRAVPAFAAELAAIRALARAEHLHQREPTPENAARVQAALLVHERAERAYRIACRQDIAAWQQAHPQSNRNGERGEESGESR